MRAAALAVLAAMHLWAARPVHAGTFQHPREGWTVTYPAGWDTNASDVEQVEGMPFQTCSASCHAQIVPEGHVEITVRTLPASTDEQAELDHFMRSPVQPVGTPVPSSPRRDYRWGKGKFQEAVIAVRKGGKLFLVQRSQQLAPGQTGNEYDAPYQAVLNSVQVPALGPAQKSN